MLAKKHIQGRTVKGWWRKDCSSGCLGLLLSSWSRSHILLVPSVVISGKVYVFWHTPSLGVLYSVGGKLLTFSFSFFFFLKPRQFSIFHTALTSFDSFLKIFTWCKAHFPNSVVFPELAPLVLDTCWTLSGYQGLIRAVGILPLVPFNEH